MTGRPSSRPPFSGVGLIFVGMEHGLSASYVTDVAVLANGHFRCSFPLWVSWALHSNALFGTAKRL